MNQNRVIVTGGSGFIGSHLTLDLLERSNDEVVLFDRDPDLRRIREHWKFKQNKDQWNTRLTFVHGDLTKAEQVYALFDKHEPRTVYHLGALLSAGAETNPTMGYDVDLLGSRHVLEAARLVRESSSHGQPCPPIKVIFPSTIASFGDYVQNHDNVPNESTQMPTTIYGVAKVSVERLGEYYYRQRRNTLDGSPWVDFRALRFPSVVGPTRGPGGTTAYSTLMCDLPIRGYNYEAYVSEETRIGIVYVKDAVKALRMLENAALDAADPIRRVFNIRGIVGDDNMPPTAGQIATAVRQAWKKAADSAAPAAKEFFKRGLGTITFARDDKLEATVRSFGILDESVTQKALGYSGEFTRLEAAVQDFIDEAWKSPGSFKRIELY